MATSSAGREHVSSVLRFEAHSAVRNLFPPSHPDIRSSSSQPTPALPSTKQAQIFSVATALLYETDPDWNRLVSEEVGARLKGLSLEESGAFFKRAEDHLAIYHFTNDNTASEQRPKGSFYKAQDLYAAMGVLVKLSPDEITNEQLVRLLHTRLLDDVQNPAISGVAVTFLSNNISTGRLHDVIQADPDLLAEVQKVSLQVLPLALSSEKTHSQVRPALDLYMRLQEGFQIADSAGYQQAVMSRLEEAFSAIKGWSVGPKAEIASGLAYMGAYMTMQPLVVFASADRSMSKYPQSEDDAIIEAASRYQRLISEVEDTGQSIPYQSRLVSEVSRLSAYLPQSMHQGIGQRIIEFLNLRHINSQSLEHILALPETMLSIEQKYKLFGQVYDTIPRENERVGYLFSDMVANSLQGHIGGAEPSAMAEVMTFVANRVDFMQKAIVNQADFRKKGLARGIYHVVRELLNAVETGRLPADQFKHTSNTLIQKLRGDYIELDSFIGLLAAPPTLVSPEKKLELVQEGFVRALKHSPAMELGRLSGLVPHLFGNAEISDEIKLEMLRLVAQNTRREGYKDPQLLKFFAEAQTFFRMQ